MARLPSWEFATYCTQLSFLAEDDDLVDDIVRSAWHMTADEARKPALECGARAIGGGGDRHSIGKLSPVGSE
jgi:hypothetical protein